MVFNDAKYNIKKAIGCFLLVLLFCCSGGDDSDDAPSADTTPPSNPTNLVESQITDSSVFLSWGASTDNIGVTNYSVYQDNTQIATTQQTSYTVNGLSTNTSYSFKIRANDLAGNSSGFSNTINITTNGYELNIANGDLENYISTIIDNAPGSDEGDYAAPNQSQLNICHDIVTAILSDNITEAIDKSGSIGYQITEFTDTTTNPSSIFYIIEKRANQSNFWGTFVFSKNPDRGNLVLMAPHSKYDTNTGKQAVYCFKNNLARAVFINGTHRCNSSEASDCSGTTSVCGSSEAYKISDMAHTVTSMYQQLTESIFDAIPSSVFIQLHGFSKQSSDPYVIMSNGTRETPATDYATLIKDALLIEDNSLTFKLAHIDTDWTRLIGFTNTQGRLINNSSDACTEAATNTSGRFIHIEQERTKLRDDESKWAKMSYALGDVFN